LSGEDAKDGRALILRRFLVDDDGRFAFAFVDRTRPPEDPDKCQAIQLGCAVVAFLYFHARHGSTISVSRKTVELARTAIRAVTIHEFAAMDRPVRTCHVSLPTVPVRVLTFPLNNS
jgi:hypothetical protein